MPILTRCSHPNPKRLEREQQVVVTGERPFKRVYASVVVVRAQPGSQRRLRVLSRQHGVAGRVKTFLSLEHFARFTMQLRLPRAKDAEPRRKRPPIVSTADSPPCGM